jgi:hypothetical protein
MSAKDELTTQEVTELTGATLRQLQFWDEKGYLRPSRGPHPAAKFGPRRGRTVYRLYSRAQLLGVKKILELTRTGLQLRHNLQLINEPWLHAVIMRKPTVVGQVLYVPARDPRKGRL